MDGTGACRRDDNNEKINCTAIPGGVIDCRDQAKLRYECVNYGVVAAAASQFSFSCTSNPESQVTDKLFDEPSSDSSKTSQPLLPATVNSRGGEYRPGLRPSLPIAQPSPSASPLNPFANDNDVY